MRKNRKKSKNISFQFKNTSGDHRFYEYILIFEHKTVPTMYEPSREIPRAQNAANITDPTVIYGHRVCQTREVKWLCLDKIYQKLNRPNMYDIGGTYMQDVADYWFTFKTELVGNISLVHLFICNHGLSSFNVSLSSGNLLRIDKKADIAYLPQYTKEYQFNSLPELTHSYLTTYSFSELDVKSLENKMLFIAVSFTTHKKESLSLDLINDIKLQHDCSALLSDPIGSDFTIESADGVKFQVHRVILTAHSEVFKAMLKEETAESQSGYVMLKDVNGEDLRSMLEFIYSGTVKDVDNANFVNLLMLADLYNLKGLLELSQYALVEQLNMDNALHILVVADMHDSDCLKTETLKFIKKNVEILKSNAFKEIDNIDLVRQLCNYLSA